LSSYRIIPAIFLPTCVLVAHEDPHEFQELPKMGNFALSTSQQPGPLVSFGENIIDQGQVQFYLFADAFIGKNSYAVDVIPGILWGIRDDFSLFVNAPFTPGDKEKKDRSAGWEDLFAQLEYAFYTGKQSQSVIQATLVANLTFPTGSSSKNPPTGFGATSFFMGSTFNYSGIDWFFFFSTGGILTTSKHGTQFGDEYLYQWGLGRNIPSPQGWIFAWMVEWNGTYFWKDRYRGRTDPDSGGNVVYLTPSIWISSDRIIIQFGAGYPIIQHLFGDQSRKFLSFDFNFGWTF
jgi:hypothetical protein